MKYLTLLIALIAGTAQAETIVMACENETGSLSAYRYSDGFLGLGTPKYEVRKESTWLPYCVSGAVPYKLVEHSIGITTCTFADKGVKKRFAVAVKTPSDESGKVLSVQITLLDFVLLTRTSDGAQARCKRLDVGLTAQQN